ncbi:MAG: FG-GAP-like repeat-containing protein, partial [Candidatus Zixiibacteriota bacterium]
IFMANDGSYNFTGADTLDAGVYIYDMVPADIDRDGDMDLVAVGDSMGVFYNDGYGELAGVYTSFLGYECYSVNVGLLDNDGYLDIAAAVESGDDVDYVAVFINDREGSFITRQTFDGIIQDQGMCSADFDDDGDIDIALCTWWSTPGKVADTIVIFSNDGNGAFARSASYITRSQAYTLYAQDLNGDGVADITVGYSEGTYMSVFLNNGSGVFGTRADYVTQERPMKMAFADFDNDSDVDIVTANLTANSFTILKNAGSGTFGTYAHTSVGAYIDDIACGDIYGDDGFADIVVGDYSNNQLVLYHGDGTGDFPSIDMFDCGVYYPYTFAAADFDNDGDIDVVVTDYEGFLLVFNNDNHLTLQTPDVYKCGHSPSNIETVDFNNDGYLDIATANEYSFDLSVYINDGAAGFDGPQSYGTAYNPTAFSCGDFNGDGNVDLACTEYSDGTFSILWNRFDVVVDVNEPDIKNALPDEFVLAQNYPNPFNASTVIEFSVPARSQVKVAIYNILGQEIKTLVDENKTAGNYRVIWDGTDVAGQVVATGVYLYQVRINDAAQVKKAILLK